MELVVPLLQGGVVMSLTGKVALVTGGAQGIGRAVVQSLLQSSAKVSVPLHLHNFTTEQLYSGLASLQSPVTLALPSLLYCLSVAGSVCNATSALVSGQLGKPVLRRLP